MVDDPGGTPLTQKITIANFLGTGAVANSVLAGTASGVASFSTAPRLANIADTGGTNRITLSTSSPHVTITSGLKVGTSSPFDGGIGIGISPLIGTYSLYIAGSATGVTGTKAGLRVSPDITLGSSFANYIGIQGLPTIRSVDGQTGIQATGLDFGVLALNYGTTTWAAITGVNILLAPNKVGAGSATFTDIVAFKNSDTAYFGIYGAPDTVTNLYTVWSNFSFGQTPHSSINNFYGFKQDSIAATNTGSAAIYGIYIGNLQRDSGTAYGIYVENAEDYAIFVDAGLSRFDGNGTHVFELPADNTAGTTTITGRIPIKIAGATRYIHYHTS